MTNENRCGKGLQGLSQNLGSWLETALLYCALVPSTHPSLRLLPSSADGRQMNADRAEKRENKTPSACASSCWWSCLSAGVFKVCVFLFLRRSIRLGIRRRRRRISKGRPWGELRAWMHSCVVAVVACCCCCISATYATPSCVALYGV